MAWDDINDHLKTTLAETRSMIGIQRQSDLSGDFMSLISLLKKRAKTPFDRLKPEFFEELNKSCLLFKEGGHWEVGDLSDQRYFYRVETLESFVYKHAKLFHSDYDVEDSIIINTDSTNIPEIFDHLITDYLKVETWRPINRLISSYFSYRGFSWWTNNFDFDNEAKFPHSFDGRGLTMENEWLVRFAFKVGIASDWLSRNMLFLRLDAKYVRAEDIRIPSVIDALLQPIFSPRVFDNQKRWGLAFDLNNDVQPVHREYVVKNIPVEAISYIPVCIELETIDAVDAKARLNESLVETLIKNI